MVHRILGLAREQVGMDAAVLAEFSEGTEVVHTVDGEGAVFDLEPGLSFLFQDSFSRVAFESTPPGLIRDVRGDPRLGEILLTNVTPVGSYIGAPVYLPDGQVWGSIYCVGHQPAENLDERDVHFLKALGRLAGEELHRREQEGEDHARKIRRVRAAMEHGVDMAFQPIYDLRSGRAIGVEALARFGAAPIRTPDRWFSEAAEVGLAVDLEVAAVRSALSLLERLPADLYLSINVSPQVVVSSRFLEAIRPYEGNRLVVELTEHVKVDNYVLLNAALASLRGRGARIAVDDLGAGFASLRHVLRLGPDIIKLDITLTRDIDSDPVRRALATSFISFAADINAGIVAEGIETAGEVGTLRTLGVASGQGFFLARPGPIEDLELLQQAG